MSREVLNALYDHRGDPMTRRVLDDTLAESGARTARLGVALWLAGVDADADAAADAAAADADADAAAADAAADAADAAADDADAAAAAAWRQSGYYWWYVNPRFVLWRHARWTLGGMTEPNPFAAFVAMYRLGCRPLGYVNGEFCIYVPKVTP